MFVVDSNVLVYAANQHSPSHVPCYALLESWQRADSPWFLTWSICYEFLRVATHPKTLESPLSAVEAWSFLAALLDSPSMGILVPTERHAAVLGQTLQELPQIAGNKMHDLHTAVLMRENGIKVIYTRDVDFHRFPFLEPIDPLRQEG